MRLQDIPGALGAALQPSGHVRPLEWLLFIVPVAVLFFGLAYLYATGESGHGPRALAPIRRYISGIERLTGLPAWAAGGIMAGEWSLLMAAIGFYWDVAWHIDFGRDKVLFTPPHMMILIGLVGVLGSALLSILLASVARAKVGFGLGRLRVPYGALPLVALGAFAAVGFPLDDLWHRTYGIDVTMWSPTHLMMIGGACFSPLALRLLLLEVGPGALETPFGRVVRRGLTGAILVALSAFQLEFDLGVPQWQALFQPVMVTGTAALVFVAARESLGRWGAVAVWVNFLVLRIFWWVLVGPVLGHVSPHFPLYLGSALLVEAAWAFGPRQRPALRALLAGALVGTIGLATEWGWSLVWARHPWHASMFPGIWAAVAIAPAGALVGIALGSVLKFRRPPVRALTTAVALAAIVAMMAVPLPRRGGTVGAVLTTSAAGEPQRALDRDGRPSAVQDVNLAVDLAPATAADNVDYFEVLSWQGGKARQTPLVPDGGGRYHAARPVPTGGTWKTAIFLTRGAEMDALPVSMPADSEYGLAAVVVQPSRRTAFVQAQRVLMAEDHAGSALPRVLAIAGFTSELGVTGILFALALWGISRGYPPVRTVPVAPRQARRRTRSQPAAPPHGRPA